MARSAPAFGARARHAIHLQPSGAVPAGAIPATWSICRTCAGRSTNQPISNWCASFTRRSTRALPEFGTDAVLALLDARPELATLNTQYQRNEGYAKSLLQDQVPLD